MTKQHSRNRRPSLWGIIGIVLAIVAVLASGCASPGAAPAPTAAPSPTSASAPAGGATTAAPAGGSVDASKEVYKIGAVFAVSGNNSPLGTPERDTAKMLEEQINAKGGINGHKIEVIAYDTQSDETTCVTSVKKLIEQDKVLAIIGPSSTGESMALIDTVEKAQIPLISCAASVTIVKPVRKWVFKTPETDSLAVATIIDYLKTKNISKIALINTSSAYGTNGKDAWNQAAGPAGIQIVATETFGDKDLDMTGQLTRIKGTDAQAVVCWGTNPGPAIVAKNMKQLQMTIPLIQSHGVANQQFITLAGDAANGVVFPAGKMLVYQTLPDSDPQKAVLSAYAKSYQDKYGKAPDTFGGYAYDAMMLVTKALEKAGPDKAKIRDANESTQGYAGITGTFSMSAEDHNGLGRASFAMVQIVDGKWTLEK